MPEIEIFGARQSTYVRVVWMTCEEKGASYVIRPADPHSAEIRALHPFGRIPAVRHGDRVLFESKAIATYLDRIFDGPRLIPDDPYEAAVVEQWVSAVNTTVEPIWTLYFRAHVFPKGPDGQPDSKVIGGQLEPMRHTVGVLESVLSSSEYLAGDHFSLADIALLPALHYFHQFPESREMVAEAPALGGYYERLRQRPSAIATVPPPMPARDV
jgi:glutathione S-transferase